MPIKYEVRSVLITLGDNFTKILTIFLTLKTDCATVMKGEVENQLATGTIVGLLGGFFA